MTFEEKLKDVAGKCCTIGPLQHAGFMSGAGWARQETIKELSLADQEERHPISHYRAMMFVYQAKLLIKEKEFAWRRRPKGLKTEYVAHINRSLGVLKDEKGTLFLWFCPELLPEKDFKVGMVEMIAPLPTLPNNLSNNGESAVEK